MPALPALGRGHLDRAQALSDFVEADGLLGGGRPGKPVLHDGGLDGRNPAPTGIPGPLRIEPRARGRARPRQPWPASSFRLAPPSPPLGNPRALLLRHGRAHGQQEVIGGASRMGRSTHATRHPRGVRASTKRS